MPKQFLILRHPLCAYTTAVNTAQARVAHKICSRVIVPPTFRNDSHSAIPLAALTDHIVRD